MEDILRPFPILVVDDELGDDTPAGQATRAVVERLEAEGAPVVTARSREDAEHVVGATSTLSGVVIDWDVHHDGGAGRAGSDGQAASVIERLRRGWPALPIFVTADRSSVQALAPTLLAQVDGYVWKLEDTPDFIARRVLEARREYLDPLLPSFFGALVRFTEEARYSWHTPGHSGGEAFLKSPAGAAFHAFFGENALRSDLSVSVGELGSLLEHSGPVGAAEAQAARTFGADRTMFVTNGTSTANKVVFCSCVRDGDVVLVDRNCHKSIMHAIILTRAIPVFLQPVRNAYGIIGPIPRGEFDAEAISARLAANPLVPAQSDEPRLAVLTNSTYDGLCYDATAVLRSLAESTRRVMFDEAWFAYAHFHPLYRGRHAMGAAEHPPRGVATFSTQSTHKLLAAFSQGSMVHLRDPTHLIGEAALDEAFMMHTSTSPQYGIIASLDVAARMMDGSAGQDLLDGVLEEAIAFRRELAALQPAADGWWFRAWQPPAAASGTASQDYAQDAWLLRDDDQWHGFGQIGDGHAMLDPTKVTILTPGISRDGVLEQFGIPATIVARFLDEHGVVVEKTGTYSFLVLFSLGITRGKAGTLLAELLEFRRLYESGAPVASVLPRLVSEHRDRYGGLSLRGLADELHDALRAAAISELSEGIHSELPQPVMTPADAYGQIVADSVEMVGTDGLAGRVSAAMVVPYPPGIPVIMPGERFPAGKAVLMRYLRACEKLALTFPGFETEIHGIQIAADGSYLVPCTPSGGHHDPAV